MAAAMQVGDQGAAGWQADLAAMGVAAEIEAVAGPCGVLGSLGRVDQGDAELAVVVVEGGQRLAGEEAVHVIEAGHPQAFPAAFEHDRAIEQHLETMAGQQVRHLDRIVVAQDREPRTTHLDRIQSMHQQRRRSLDVGLGMAVHVTGERQQVDLDALQQAARDIRQFGKVVEVGIADVQRRRLERLPDRGDCETERHVAPARAPARPVDPVGAALDGAPPLGPILLGHARPIAGGAKKKGGLPPETALPFPRPRPGSDGRGDTGILLVLEGVARLLENVQRRIGQLGAVPIEEHHEVLRSCRRRRRRRRRGLGGASAQQVRCGDETQQFLQHKDIPLT